MRINHLSQQELNDLLEQVKTRTVSLRQEQLVALRTRLSEEIAAAGFEVAEVFGRVKTVGKSKANAVTVKKAKFRDQADPSRTWSGHGRAPQWYKDALASGATPESMMDGAKASTPVAAPATAVSKKPGKATRKARATPVVAKKATPKVVAKKAAPAKKTAVKKSVGAKKSSAKKAA